MSTTLSRAKGERMASGIFDDALLKHNWGTDELRAIFNDRNRVQKWYDYEAALALEQAELGIIPRAAAQEIAAKASAADVDLEALGAEIRKISHVLVPALRALQARCSGGYGEYIHFGPTTQDVLDTGAVLQMKDAHAIFLRDLKAIGKELYRLSGTHKATPMVGRTHGVQALPITFGHKCAVWLSEMGRHHERLRQCEPRVFVGQMVGAVGTQASYGPQAPELDRRLMKRLGLGVADISWQSARDRFAEFGGVWHRCVTEPSVEDTPAGMESATYGFVGHAPDRTSARHRTVSPSIQGISPPLLGMVTRLGQ